jgi:hypothetical protein
VLVSELILGFCQLQIFFFKYNTNINTYTRVYIEKCKNVLILFSMYFNPVFSFLCRTVHSSLLASIRKPAALKGKKRVWIFWLKGKARAIYNWGAPFPLFFFLLVFGWGLLFGPSHFKCVWRRWRQKVRVTSAILYSIAFAANTECRPCNT